MDSRTEKRELDALSDNGPLAGALEVEAVLEGHGPRTRRAQSLIAEARERTTRAQAAVRAGTYDPFEGLS